jgi:hypothetical protein
MQPHLSLAFPQCAGPDFGKRALLRFLVRQLFLSNLDLQAYRILLMAATGRTPEEVTALDEDGSAHTRDDRLHQGSGALTHPPSVQHSSAETLVVCIRTS